jgi:murein DD-endopeptidase MepM/ murein hydrolase activator NlpD
VLEPSRSRLGLASVIVLGVALAVWGTRRDPALTPPADTADPASAPAVGGPDTPAAQVPAPSERQETVIVRRGQTFVTALRAAGVEFRPAAEAAAALRRAGADLRRLKPGQKIEITWSASGEPTAIAWQAGPWLGYAAVLGEEGWSVRRFETEPDVRVTAVSGRVETSLFQAVEDAGESAPLVLELVRIFESDFDFTADTQRGDRFRLLVEKRYAGEAFVSYGRVLAAQYRSAGRTLTGVGYAPRGDQGFAYYDLAGQSLRKTFLKSPLEFSRITSGFSYARPHPILGGVRPHLAIDYAAPVGTPVRAVADGVVLVAGWNGGNGIQVHLRHRSGYETIYNHLSRVAAGVRPGVRVSQRQVIGYVGATGLATGPHLDYRVRRHGVFVNPLSEKFLPGEPIAAAEKPAFTRHARALLERLDREAPF